MSLNLKPLEISYSYTPLHDTVCGAMNFISSNYGVPFSKELVSSGYQSAYAKEKELKEYLTKEYAYIGGYEYIDFTGRGFISPHIANIIYTYYKDCLPSPNPFETKVKRGGSTNSEYTVKDEIVNNVRDIIHSRTNDTDLIDKFIELKDTSKFLRSIDQIFDWYLRDKTDNDYFPVNPTSEVKDTFRLATNNPNIQGKPKAVKEMIMAPSGYKVMTIDISGQEVHILLFGIMRNKELQRLYIEIGDPYYAILKYLGYPQTPEYKAYVKVPVLGCMNGMELETMITDMGYQRFTNDIEQERNNELILELATAIKNLIEKDEGFQEVVQSHVDSQKNRDNAVAVGLFGTERIIPKFKKGKAVSSASRRNMLRNGFFQITASEIVSLSLQALIHYIMNNEHGITFDDFRPVISIYDEFVFIYKEELEAEAYEIVDNFMRPKVENWARFRGEIITGKYYGHK